VVENNISEHVTYQEGIVSATGERLGIVNTPTPAALQNMKDTAKFIFEPLRAHFEQPIQIISFFRGPKLNKAVGGASNSQHMTGEAMDLRGMNGITNAQLFEYIKNNLPFDQLIWEFGDNNEPSWVHVSYSKRNRKNVLKAEKVNGKTIYKTL
jgi:hypothetical protein